jgi:alpha-amylase
MNKFVAYARVIYNPEKTSATITIISQINKRYNVKLLYSFNGERETEINTYSVTNIFLKDLNIKVIGKMEKSSEMLNLEPINFIWQNGRVNQSSEYRNGQKGAIVEMFGWPYKDIEKECSSLGIIVLI